MKRCWNFGLVGLVVANPGIADWSFFYPHIQQALNSVYGERAVMPQGAPDKWFPIMANFKNFRTDGASLGLPWIGLTALGAVASFRRSFRRFWPVTFVFPAVFWVYFVFVAPWVRRQELMLFFPSFAIWAGMGLVSLNQWMATASSRPALRRLAMFFLVLWVLCDVSLSGIRRASTFAWPDPRIQSREWLAVHAPTDRVIGLGSQYVDPAFRVPGLKHVDIGPIERLSMESIRRKGVEYIIRDPLARGRNTVNPVTGRLYPEFQSNWNAFAGEARRLWQWTTLDPPLFSFGCMPVEYWGLIQAAPAMTMNLPVFQPGFVTLAMHSGAWLMPEPLGSIKMVEVSRYPRDIVIGGPAEPGRAVYLLLQTLNHHAVVRVGGLGQTRRVSLPPYSVEVLTLRRPWYVPRLNVYDIVTVGAEPEPYAIQIQCYAETLLDEGAVACSLIQKGYPDKALAFLKQREESRGWMDAKTVWPAFAAATEQGDWALADALHAEAEALLCKLRQAGTVSERALLLNGVNGIYYDDHSRIRMTSMALLMEPPPEVEHPPTNVTVEVDLPPRPARGDYQLHFTIGVSGSNEGSVPVAIHATGGLPWRCGCPPIRGKW